MSQPAVVEVAEVERALRLLVAPGDTYEVRAIAKTKYGRGEEILSGYFRGNAATTIQRSDTRDVIGWYVTLNPVNPALHARRADRLDKVGKDSTTKDTHVTKRTRILIDVDPARPTGISSSDAEHAAAIALASEIEEDLLARGWPAGLLTDSGNGGHIVHAIDLPTEDDGLVEQLLAAMAARWNRTVDGVTLKIDTSNANPSRITKLYGTPARKGDNVPERPHRSSRLLHAPPKLETVTREQIEAFVAEFAPQPKTDPRSKAGNHAGDTGNGHPRAPRDVGRWLVDHGIAIRNTDTSYNGKHGIGVLHELAECPYNPEHGDRGETFVIQFSRGGIKAGCPHDGCKTAGWGWSWLLDKYEPKKAEPSRGSQSDHAPPTIEWTDPQPLKSPLPPVPPFDPALLPSDLRPWLVDIATRMQVPLEMVAVAAMSALSVVACSARTVHPKRYDDWRVWPVLWGVAIAPAGSKKTPSMKEAQRPLDMLDALERKRWAADSARREAIIMVAKAKQAAAEKLLKKAAEKHHADDALTELASDVVKTAGEDLTVRARRYTTQDTTTEKISDLVNRAGEGKRSYPLGVMRDELIGLLQTFDREGREGDRAFYLEGWSVNDRSIDRIGRGEINIKDLCLVVFGNATPGPFEAYVREATRGPDADGFLQRLQLAVYPDPITEPSYVDRSVDHIAANRALGVFERLANIREEDKRGKPPALRFSDEAQPFFEAWFVELERSLAKSEAHHALISHFSKYRSLMPSLALVLHLASEAGSETMPVSLAAAKQAAAWCGFLMAHAKRIYSIAAHPEYVVASLIVKRVRSGKLAGEMSLRDIERTIAGHEAEVVRLAVEVLEDLGWCRTAVVKRPGGGRPSERVTFNPRGKA